MENNDLGLSWIEQIKKILDHQRGLQEHIEMILEPQRILHQQLDKVLEFQWAWQEYIAKLVEPQQVWQKQFDRLLEHRLRLDEYFNKLLEPQRLWQQQLDNLVEPHWQWQEQIQRLIEPQKRWKEILEKYLSDLKSLQIEVDPSGAVILGNELFSSSEVASELDSLTQELASASTFIEYLARISAYLESIGKPFAQILLVILIPYIITIFANLTTPIYEEWWREYGGKTKEEITRCIREDTLATYDIEQLKGQRFVNAAMLRVRKDPSNEADIIDKLHLGKVAKVLKKEGGWFLVEYLVENEDTLRRGWVFSRYLAKFTE
jgi:hypothetical protein